MIRDAVSGASPDLYERLCPSLRPVVLFRSFSSLHLVSGLCITMASRFVGLSVFDAVVLRIAYLCISRLNSTLHWFTQGILITDVQ